MDGWMDGRGGKEDRGREREEEGWREGGREEAGR